MPLPTAGRGLRLSLALGLLLGGLYACGQSYVEWNARTQLASRALGAQDALREVQALQRLCHRRLGRYCRDVDELVRIHDDERGGKKREVEQLRRQPREAPGRSSGRAHTGSAYFIEVTRASSADFEARARHVGLASLGEEVWVIGPEGPPRHVAVSPRWQHRPQLAFLGLALVGVAIAVAWPRRARRRA